MRSRSSVGTLHLGFEAISSFRFFLVGFLLFFLLRRLLLAFILATRCLNGVYLLNWDLRGMDSRSLGFLFFVFVF